MLVLPKDYQLKLQRLRAAPKFRPDAVTMYQGVLNESDRQRAEGLEVTGRRKAEWKTSAKA